MSRTRCASSDRDATSASSGRVQSISTTWTATSSAFVGRASSQASRTIRSSLGPPLTAMTTRRIACGLASGTAVTIPPAGAAVSRSERLLVPGRPAAAVVSAGPPPSLPVGALEPGRVLASVRDVDDDGVGPAEEGRPEPLRRLVVEDPLPPVAGDVLGDDDERDRRLLVRRPGSVEDVEVGEQRPDERPVRRLDDDERDARHLALPALAHLGRSAPGRPRCRPPGRRR